MLIDVDGGVLLAVASECEGDISNGEVLIDSSSFKTAISRSLRFNQVKAVFATSLVSSR